jgi:hypothetical protein
MKPQSFGVLDIKSSEGPETIAFSCWLTYEERKIVSISNEGMGEGHKYTWENRMVKEEFQAVVTDEMIWDLIEDKVPLSEGEVEARIAVGR